MNIRKLILILNILSIFILTGCESTNTINYNSDIKVKGPSLKISLIQTAYEIYNVNIENCSNDSTYKDLYENTSRYAKKHYKWLVKTYNSMDNNMKIKLKNIFDSNSSWLYTNSVINLDDDANIDDIINTLVNEENLNLSSDLKNDIDEFLNYFYDDYFKSYFNKNKYSLNKKANKLNEVLHSNDVDIKNFIEKVCKVTPSDDYICTFYYSLNPISSQNFEFEENIISTIEPTTTPKDIIRVPIHKYSHSLFDSFTDSDEFLDIFEMLKSDDDLISAYNEYGSNSYDFDEWCEENLIEGFSKYLDYRYSQYEYDFSNLVYDLDFYNYLKEINFNPDKVNLKDVCIDFYNICLDS